METTIFLIRHPNLMTFLLFMKSIIPVLLCIGIVLLFKKRKGNQTKIIDNKNTEVRQKCNACGRIFCYDNTDLKKNRAHKIQAGFSIFNQIMGKSSRSPTAQAIENINFNQSINRIVNYSKCPKCGSTDLRTLNNRSF